MSVSSVAQARSIDRQLPVLRTLRPLFTTGVGLASVVSVVTVLVVLVGVGGWRYYATPLDVRATLVLDMMMVV